MQITKDMIVSDIMNMDPGVVPIFMEHGLYCMGCFLAGDESLEEAAQVDMVDLDHLLLSLNQYFGFDEGEYDMHGNPSDSPDYDQSAQPATSNSRSKNAPLTVSDGNVDENAENISASPNIQQ